MDKKLSYYIHVEEMRPIGSLSFAAKPILSRRFARDSSDEAPPTGEQWARTREEAIAKVRTAMQKWAQQNGFALSEG